MASFIDELTARQGTVIDGLEGVNWAKAADRLWARDRHESEHAFRLRIRAEAAAAGYRLVQIGGAIETGPPIVVQFPDRR